MRLIDADVFKEYIRESFEEAKGEFQTEKYLQIADSVTEGFLKDIDEQPTVEAKPVVHGEWVHLGGDEWCCSECGHVITTEGSWEKPEMKFCEECGADMRGEIND